MLIDFLSNYWWFFVVLGSVFLFLGVFLQLRNIRDIGRIGIQSMEENIFWRFGPPIISFLAGLLSFIGATIGLIAALVERMK